VRLRAIVTALLAGALVPAAGARGTAAPPLKFAVPKPGTIVVYDVKVTVQLPPTMTLGPGIAPSLKATNASKLPKSVDAAATVVQSGKNSWVIAVAIRRNKTAGAGAGALTAMVTLSGPLAGAPTTDSPPVPDPGCKGFKKNGSTAEAIWLLVRQNYDDTETTNEIMRKASCL
jgi:hypothetical protein